MTISPIVIATFLYGLGVVLRVIVPYALAKVNPENPTESFDVRKMIGSGITAIGGYVTLLLTTPILADIQELLAAFTAYGDYVMYVVVLFVGYTATDIGRLAQKANEVRIIRKNGN